MEKNRKDLDESLQDIRQTVMSINGLKKEISMQKEGSLNPSLKYILHLFECISMTLEGCGHHENSLEKKKAIKQTRNLIDDEMKKIEKFLKTAN